MNFPSSPASSRPVSIERIITTIERHLFSGPFATLSFLLHTVVFESPVLPRITMQVQARRSASQCICTRLLQSTRPESCISKNSTSHNNHGYSYSTYCTPYHCVQPAMLSPRETAICRALGTATTLPEITVSRILVNFSFRFSLAKLELFGAVSKNKEYPFQPPLMRDFIWELQVGRLLGIVAMTTSQVFTYSIIGSCLTVKRLSSSHFLFFLFLVFVFGCVVRVLVMCILGEASERALDMGSESNELG